MKISKSSSSVEEFVARSCPATKPIIQKLRKVVMTTFPAAQEIFYHGTLGYSSSGRPYDRIIYIWPTSTHVTLGFFFGTSLPDPNHLLVGIGKRMRHVKVRTMEEASNPALRILVRAASANSTKSLSNLHKKFSLTKRSVSKDESQKTQEYTGHH
jgi:hypothetical protein